MRKAGRIKWKLNKNRILFGCYLIFVVVAGIFVVGKSIGICLDLAGKENGGAGVVRVVNRSFTVLFGQLFPNLYYEENCGSQEEYVYENAIPGYFYEDEDTKSPETIMALESGESDPNVTQTGITPVAAAALPETGVTYSDKQLSDYDFLYQNFYVVDSSTDLKKSELDGTKLLAEDLTVDTASQDYKILIYHTHGSEAFADSRPDTIEDTIIGVGDVLTEALESKYGMHVYHDRSIYDMVDGKLDRSYAYTLSKRGVKKILEQYPSIEVIIDLHRDGVAESTRLVTQINGKQTAKVMFLNGMSRSKKNGDITYLKNPYKRTNLAFSLQMFLKGKALYGDFLRKIYIRSYCYNLNLMPRATLIEAGAQTNTVEEEKNAMEPLADILYQVLHGD